MTTRLEELLELQKRLMASHENMQRGMDALISMALAETNKHQWLTANEAAAAIGGIVSGKTLKDMAADGRLTYGEHYIQLDKGIYKFKPAAVEQYFTTRPEARGRDAIAA